MPKSSTETKSQVLLVRQEDPMNPTSFVGPVSRAFVALLGIAAPNQHMFRENGKRFPNKGLRRRQSPAVSRSLQSRIKPWPAGRNFPAVCAGQQGGGGASTRLGSIALRPSGQVS